MLEKQINIQNKIDSNIDFKISHFKSEIRKTQPHKHNNYFEIIYLSKGSGNHQIDNIKYDIKPPILFLIKKEQIHCWDIKEKPEGYVIIIKKSFIEKTLDNELKLLFSNLSKLTSIEIEKHSCLEKFFELLIEENTIVTEHTFSITEGLLKAIVSKILEIAKPTIQNSAVQSDLYQSYTEILSSGKVLKNKVAYYAQILNTSPQNLNAICRKVANQSASEVLSEHILNEAKRLLIYTSKTVLEISYELDFSDSSHFIKYFKKSTGKTPLKYRVEI